jgi:hypothetical protein
MLLDRKVTRVAACTHAYTLCIACDAIVEVRRVSVIVRGKKSCFTQA